MVARVEVGDRRERFLGSLINDLITAGFSVTGDVRNGVPRIISPPEDAAQILRLRALWLAQIDAMEPFISRVEQNGVLGCFGDGRSINVQKIRPEIHFCSSRPEHKIFTYAKLFQQIPTTNRVGRQLRALVYDIGQRRPVLMGILELASSAYTLGCRDDYLHWRGATRKAIKDEGLRRIMDLASVMALPPYNMLYGGKLMASLALADPLRREFERRYGTELLGLVTTSVTGLHCAILNRIGLKPGGLYRRIGATSGYTTIFASARTLSEARRFLPSFVNAPKGHFSISVRPLHVLRVAMRACGITPDSILRSGHSKGVYFGAISDEHIAALRSDQEFGLSNGLTTDVIIDYWREKFLAKALANEAKLAKFIAYVRRGPRESSVVGTV